MTYYKDVMDRIQEYQPELVPDERWRRKLYWDLTREERIELHVAEKNWNIVESYDAICDTIWCMYWVWKKRWDDLLTSYTTNKLRKSHYNIDCFKECREEVKRSNRTKSKERREDWKIIKWPNYEAPNLLPIIKKYHDLYNS
jgi:hypothetical protein